VTSTCGSILLTYSSLCLLDKLGKLSAVALAETRPNLLTAACLALVALGVVTQLYLERRRADREDAKQETERQQQAAQEMERKLKEQEQQQKSWWGWAKKHYRRAG